MDNKFSRIVRLIGAEAADRLTNLRVIIFGIGGVGSWTAEALARSGIGHITIVDPDRVAASNINRQAVAFIDTIGRMKVDVMREIMLRINPELSVETRAEVYNAETADSFNLDSYDYVVDAIDSVADKALLILRATASKAKLISSMGAALKTDPGRIAVAEFWKVKGCPLAAALRHRFKKAGIFPRKKFKCVFSDELHPNLGPEPDTSGTMTFGKKAVNGALCQATASFGLRIAALIIN